MEVRKNGIWGTDCNDNTNENLWSNSQTVDDNTAVVVCKQLGKKGGQLLELSIVNDGADQIWLDDVDCAGTETKIDGCTHAAYGTNNCDHAKDIGVGCDTGDGESQIHA